MNCCMLLSAYFAFFFPARSFTCLGILFPLWGFSQDQWNIYNGHIDSIYLVDLDSKILVMLIA